MPKQVIRRTTPEPGDESAVSHHINRAAFRLPVMQARVLQVVLSQLRPADTSFPTVEMSVGDILRALGLEDTGWYREEIRAATKGLMGHVLDVGDWETGWTQFHFVEKTRYIKTRDSLQIRLSEELGELALDLKGLFTMLSNEEFAKLSGEYAIRIFQLLSSWKDKAGKDGNKPGCWWWDTDFDTLRHLMKVPSDVYRGSDGTTNFKRFVIENPVKEINAADLGLTISTEYKKRGRTIVGVRFNCKLTAKAKPIGKVPTAEDKETLKRRKTAKWKEFFDIRMAQPELPGFEQVSELERIEQHKIGADRDYELWISDIKTI